MIGIAVYMMFSVVECFLYDLPNGVYLPIAAIGAAFVMTGFRVGKEEKMPPTAKALIISTK